MVWTDTPEDVHVRGNEVERLKLRVGSGLEP